MGGGGGRRGEEQQASCLVAKQAVETPQVLTISYSFACCVLALLLDIKLLLGGLCFYLFVYLVYLWC